MTFAGLFGFIAMLLAGGNPSPPPVFSPVIRTMTVEQQLILRVPVRPHPAISLRWEEEKGPKCLPVGAIAGAMLARPGTVDLVLRNRQRIRAKLDSDCDGLDFYGSFYMQSSDGEVCAKRDSIRGRAGGLCRIEKFKLLVPQVDR
ncbi:MAG: hypothetical protein ABIN83_05840 [Sphingomicrobium sp.]